MAPPESENGGADAISVYRNEDQKTRREGSIENKDNYDRLREEINKLAASKSDLDTTVEALRSELDRELKVDCIYLFTMDLLMNLFAIPVEKRSFDNIAESTSNTAINGQVCCLS